MRKILTILIFCILTFKTYSQDTIVSIAYTPNQPISNFEDRDTSNYFYLDTTQLNNIWQIGTPSKTIFNSAYSVPLALVTDTLNTYPNVNISSFEIVVRTDDWTYISFFNRINSDSLNDGGIVEVSNDNGASWTNIINEPGYILTNFYNSANTISSNSNKPGFTGNSGWVLSTIHFPGALNYVRFKFTFTSDNINTNKDGWMIDNFQFQCVGTGINEIGINSPIHIFPNPTSNFIFISADYPFQVKTTIVKDISGRIVFSTDNSTIDLSQFESGVYLIEIKTDRENYVARIIKQ